MERLFGDDGYLVGGRFTRADLALCAMAAHVFRPAQHCFPWPAATEYPPGLLDDYQRFEGRPIQHYVLEHYRTSRSPDAVSIEVMDADGDALPATPGAGG
jgi:glutathione S-transferase